MLEKLRKYSSVEEIKECVRDFYHTFDNDSYIPGIFKKKTFLSRNSNYNGEFYAKLIIMLMINIFHQRKILINL